MPARSTGKTLSRLLLTFALVGAGCGDDSTAPTPDVITPGRLEASAVPAGAAAGATISPPPLVTLRDTKGRPLAGASVSFEVTAGGGSIERTTSLTASDGTAGPGGWVLGTRPGSNVLEARSAGVAPVSVTVLASPGPPASLLLEAGDGQSAIVAQQVAIAPSVAVRDAFGNPVAGVAVQFAVSEGAGQVSGGSATSDSSGIARVAAWIMGTRVGSNRLTASSAGAMPVVFTATATPGPLAAMARVAGDGQTGAVGELVAVAPAVSLGDAYGNAVPNTEVTFASATGTLTGAVTRSDAAGVARLGGWRLGLAAGTQTLEARAGVLSATFTAMASPGPAALLEAAVGQNQSAVSGTAVPVKPAVRVRDAGGNLVPGIAVRFTVTSGGGTVSGGTVVSGADGMATVGGWTLGTIAGPNRLTASVAGATAAVFDVVGLTGPAARVVKAAGDGQSVAAGTAVPVRPTVRVTDINGNPVSGATVNFAPSPGSSVTGAIQATTTDGTASAGEWVLATVAGTNTLDASVPGVGTVTFRATGVTYVPPAPPFHIELRFLTAISEAQRQAFQDAGARWESIITADVADGPLNAPAGTCGTASPAIDQVIDDLVILVTLEPIDGVGSVLGSAGPCWVRDGGNLPLLGHMRFDTADLAALEQSGRLGDVILHEMGHVLGIGTIWSSLGLLQGEGTDDPFFGGGGARQRFLLAGGSSPAGVPVENTGAAATRDAHWRETVFRTELMTGWISAPGIANPLSAVTIASLGDLGYSVDVGKADPFSLSGVQGYQLDTPPGIELIEERLPAPRVAR